MDGYKFQRTVIGILGIALGFICIFGGMIQSDILQSSISAYYHTNVRDIFVGVLMVSSLFLFAYKGYDSIDFITSNIAGVTALGISIFPCLPINYVIGGKVGFFQLGYLASNILHLVCAGIFFCSLIYIILFLFVSCQKNHWSSAGDMNGTEIIYKPFQKLILIKKRIQDKQ